jgi:5-methylcytosine-specific restriction endonuclease McrA
MPVAPPRPCRNRSCGRTTTARDGYCDTGGCRPAARRQADSTPQRREHHAFYSAAAWRAVRREVLARDPVCMACQDELSSVGAHKVPARLLRDLAQVFALVATTTTTTSRPRGEHLIADRCARYGIAIKVEGDVVTFVRIHQDGDVAVLWSTCSYDLLVSGHDYALDPEAVAGWCRRCHDADSGREAHRTGGSSVAGRTQVALLSTQRQWGFSIPHGVQLSAIPVTLVCGPPAAGKSTYVQERAAPSDLVIDLNLCRISVGGQPWDDDPDILRLAFAERAALIRSLASRCEGKAWLIVTAPTQVEREQWTKALGVAEVILLDVTAEVCIARIAADPNRAPAREKLEEGVKTWWRAFGAENRQLQGRGGVNLADDGRAYRRVSQTRVPSKFAGGGVVGHGDE